VVVRSTGMTERMQGHENSSRHRRRRWRLCIVAAALLGLGLFAILYFAGGRSRESLAQRIAAVNAAHVLPPEQNAATIYDQLVASGVLTGTDPNLIPAAYAALVKASGMESCWFPLVPGEQCYREHGARNLPMRQWMFTLISLAQTDVMGERYDAAVEKLDGLVRMAGHLQQQLLISDSAVGMAIEVHVWLTWTECVMQEDGAEELLRAAEAIPPDKLANTYKEFSSQVLQVNALIKESGRAEQTLPRRIEEWWREIRDPIKSAEENFDRTYLSLLCRRRGVRIVAGLWRYHEANRRWPDSLDDIKTLVPEQALIDPFTEQMFVYRKEVGGQFTLYSKGPNEIDDNGLRGGKADDYRIWPRYGITAPQKGTSQQKERTGGLERNP